MALNKRSQRGAALITVMLMSIIVIAILANIFYRHGIDVARAAKTMHGEQAALLALSGESWAIQVLKDDETDNPGVDHLQENWAYGLPLLPVEGGSLTGHLEDLQGRININALGLYDSSGKVSTATTNATSVPYKNSYYGLFLQLIDTLQIDMYPSQIAAITDWLDTNDVPLSGGAEDNEYLLKEAPYRAANQSIQDLEELLLIEGMTPELFAYLSPYINALPMANNVTPTTINVNTASQAVLQSLHPDIDETVAESLILTREESPWETVDSFYESVGIELSLDNAVTDARTMLSVTNTTSTTQSGNQNDNSGGGGATQTTSTSLISVNTNYFLLTVAVQLGTNTVQLQSVLRRRSANDVVVLSRTLRYLPNTVAPTTEEQQTQSEEAG